MPTTHEPTQPTTPAPGQEAEAADTGVAEAAGRALGEVVDEGLFAVGGQVAVIANGRVVVDIAAGEAGGGGAMTPEVMHNVYCLVKPAVYLLLGHALESNGVGPDQPLDGRAGLPGWAPPGLTYRQLAAHDAELAEPTGIAWRMTPPDQRQALLRQSHNGLGPAYSELCGGLIAEHIIENLTGLPAARYCTDELLAPLGLDGETAIDPERAAAARHRIRVPVIGLPFDPWPMISELLPAMIAETRPALGAFATTRGIARLYDAFGKTMAGHPQPGLPSPELLQDLLDDDRPFRHDPILDRPAKWAAGLMTDLAKQGISQAAGRDAVAHTGGMANGAALHDPSRNATIAVCLNGVGNDYHDSALPRRQLLDTVLNAIPAPQAHNPAP